MTLPANAYNPSLIGFQNRLLLSYRVHGNDWRTSLGICELDSALSPILCKPILPPDEHKNNSHEDARLFFHQGTLWISWSISLWPTTQFRGVVAYGQLLETDTGWQVAKCIIPRYGRNDFSAIEKNWVFWSHDGKLYCLYLTHGNEQNILRLEGEGVVGVISSMALPWGWGPVHGGTIIRKDDGNFLHFFNSRTGGIDRNQHRYHVGCAELASEPPFAMLSISKRPILSGEEGYCLDGNPRFKSNVVFCCGAIREGSEWLVSFGHNDNDCRIVRLRKEQLNL